MKRIKTWEINPPTHKPKSSLVAQTVKGLPAVQETRVWYLAWEDPLEKGMAIHSSILAWKIPWMEEPGGLQSTGSQRVRWLNYFTFTFEGDGLPWWLSGKESTCQRHRFNLWVRKISWRRKWQPTQYFCLGNPRNRVLQSRLQSMRSQKVDHDWTTKHQQHTR